jgi:two-component system cell cycle sensor histidine kinase/response regulator CckA
MPGKRGSPPSQPGAEPPDTPEQQARRMEALARLSGGIAHDLNNFLTVISGYTELALGRLPETDPLARPLREVRKAGEDAAAFSRRLMAIGGRQAAKPESVDLGEVLAAAEPRLREAAGPGVRLEIVRGPALGRVLADPALIEQGVSCLAANARDAMPGGGSLSIEVSNADLREDEARALPGLRAGPHVRIRVRDAGEGMDAATLARAFEPFFTTRPKGKGKGLGLSLAWGVVRQSGGAISLASEPGRGTTVDIHLPREA